MRAAYFIMYFGQHVLRTGSAPDTTVRSKYLPIHLTKMFLPRLSKLERQVKRWGNAGRIPATKLR